MYAFMDGDLGTGGYRGYRFDAATDVKFLWESAMKTAAQLLNEFLPLARNPKKGALLFAEDGVVELPYLTELGMQWQYKGRSKIASLYALLLQLAPESECRDVVVLIDTSESAFAEYKVDAQAVATQQSFKQHFFGYIHVEDGKIKLLRPEHRDDSVLVLPQRIG
jgi:hypothetical protein